MVHILPIFIVRKNSATLNLFNPIVANVLASGVFHFFFSHPTTNLASAVAGLPGNARPIDGACLYLNQSSHYEEYKFICKFHLTFRYTYGKITD